MPPSAKAHPATHVRSSSASSCNQPNKRALTITEYIALIRQAESRLAVAGHTTVSDRAHILCGIYYGTTSSLDYSVEHSYLRNAAFQIYTAHSPTSGSDPLPVNEIGCGLFLSLQKSQDVGGVDMGHILIGIDARMSWTSRIPEMPLTGASGVEVTTWVGDLGGATARLALDRIKNPTATADRYFRGTDYGAPSNLEGDVAAYLVADDPASDSVSAPNMPTDSIADALTYYFAHLHYPSHYRRFLELQGGIFSGHSMTNRPAVQTSVATKLSAFGKRYLQQYTSSPNRHYTEAEQKAAEAGLDRASQEVARKFLDWLLAQTIAKSPAHHHRKRRAQGK